MEKGGISSRLIRFAEVMVGRLPGGLTVVAVIAACFFAAISGSGPATVAALGVILIPAMAQRGYDKGMASALLASAGSIGIIIPPSVAFVIYATLAEVSVGEIFMAGIIPGLVMGACLIVCSYFLIRNNKEIINSKSFSAKEKLLAFKDAFWGIMAPVIILGGIYGGFFTPTEAAGVAVIWGLFVGVFIYKEIKIKELLKVLADSAVSTAVVMYVVACASVFAWLLTTSMLANDLTEGIMALTTSKVMLLLLMNAVFLIAGCFLDTISAYYILVPIMLPIALQLGLDPVHFGVFITVNLAIGQFTPPVGVNLYVACNIARLPVQAVVAKIIPYIIASIVALLIITFIPEVSMWLPDTLFK